MPEIVKFAIIYFSLALLFYSIGVWAERLKKTLRPWHLICFWLGLSADSAGTYYVSTQVGGLWLFNFHTVTGILGLTLMSIHTVWASVIIFKKDAKLLTSFHRFSVIVWLIWLIPYFTGFFSGLAK
ncbi:MAG: TIGR03987 family protein [Flavobacteriaceae bacterium]|nr:TIGR03987 family protein [Flavobacteriaceae bacterium]